MKSYKSEALRNISLLAHGSAGKTSLTEAMLFATGVINRLGKVEEGTTVADFDDEEIQRRISLGTALIPCEWDGCKINVLDTPGYADFIGEVHQAVRNRFSLRSAGRHRGRVGHGRAGRAAPNDCHQQDGSRQRQL